MGGTVRPTPPGSSPGGAFPLVVAAVCATLAILLFLTDTVPAIREADDLRSARDDRLDFLRRLVRETHELTQRERALDWDPQTVLAEIDRLGMTPQELVAGDGDGDGR